MNNLDVAGILTTYALKCSQTTKKGKLQELIRDLKRELNAKEINNFTIANNLD